MTAKARCAVCGNRHALRKNGLVVSHERAGYQHCPGSGQLPADPATQPTWEARALDAEARVRSAEARLDQLIEQLTSLPVQKGGVIRVSDLSAVLDRTGASQ